jgi:hypothetical protein
MASSQPAGTIADMLPTLDRIITTSDLPAAELCAARLDGEVFMVADCFSPVDLPAQSADRAAALTAGLPSRLIAELHSAAWVLGAIACEPADHQFCSATDARAKPADLHGMTVREVVISPSETIAVGGARVTSPLRTACDLVRSSDLFDDDDRQIVLRLLRLGGATVDDCIEVLAARRNLPGKKLALTRLELLRAA